MRIAAPSQVLAPCAATASAPNRTKREEVITEDRRSLYEADHLLQDRRTLQVETTQLL